MVLTLDETSLIVDSGVRSRWSYFSHARIIVRDTLAKEPPPIKTRCVGSASSQRARVRGNGSREGRKDEFGMLAGNYGVVTRCWVKSLSFIIESKGRPTGYSANVRQKIKNLIHWTLYCMVNAGSGMVNQLMYFLRKGKHILWTFKEAQTRRNNLRFTFKI